MTAARALHDRILVLDSHVDLLERMLDDAYDPLAEHGEGEPGRGCLDLPRLRRAGVGALGCAAFLLQGPLEAAACDAAWERALAMFERLEQLGRRAPERCGIARNLADLERLHREGRLACFPALENAYPLGQDLARLDRLAARGLRYVTLCHWGENGVCGSSRSEQGLTPFGGDLIARMNALGVMVDVSHTSPRATLEAAEASRAPVIASHSSCRALCEHPRNLTDAGIRAIAQTGGVIQVCAYGPFLREGAPEAGSCIADLVDHLEHVIRLVGPEHAGIGTDFDGGGGLEDLPEVSALPRLTGELLRRGWPEARIAQVWGGNFIRVWREAEQAAASIHPKDSGDRSLD